MNYNHLEPVLHDWYGIRRAIQSSLNYYYCKWFSILFISWKHNTEQQPRVVLTISYYRDQKHQKQNQKPHSCLRITVLSGYVWVHACRCEYQRANNGPQRIGRKIGRINFSCLLKKWTDKNGWCACHSNYWTAGLVMYQGHHPQEVVSGLCFGPVSFAWPICSH